MPSIEMIRKAARRVEEKMREYIDISDIIEDDEDEVQALNFEQDD